MLSLSTSTRISNLEQQKKDGSNVWKTIEAMSKKVSGKGTRTSGLEEP